MWLPHPKPDDPIGDALRSLIPKQAVEAMPADIKALLFILKTVPVDLMTDEEEPCAGIRCCREASLDTLQRLGD